MLDPKLFVGFRLDDELSSHLVDAKPHLVQAFIDNEEYLHRAQIGDRTYIGKFAESTADVEQLQLLRANVQSLLERVVGKDVPSLNPLLLALPAT